MQWGLQQEGKYTKISFLPLSLVDVPFGFYTMNAHLEREDRGRAVGLPLYVCLVACMPRICYKCFIILSGTQKTMSFNSNHTEGENVCMVRTGIATMFLISPIPNLIDNMKI